MSQAAIFIKREKAFDVWKCWSCRTRFSKQKEQRGAVVECPICKELNKLYPYGEERQSPLPFFKKIILDASCGGKMFWFNKNHPAALYIDNRREEKGFVKERPNFEIQPDIIMDFREMHFPDKTFKLVVFDPPHIKFRGYKSWASQKYGSLNPKTWAVDLKKGFDECWRVLQDHGILIFKWSVERDSRSIQIKEILTLVGKVPLFGHTTGKSGKTIWMCFMKIPNDRP